LLQEPLTTYTTCPKCAFLPFCHEGISSGISQKSKGLDDHGVA